MNKLRPTIVATLVSAALASTASSASVNTQISLPNFDSSSIANKSALKSSMQQKTLAEMPTRSGMPSSYDAKMGKATFLWAAQGQSKPDLSLIAPELRSSYAASYYLNSLTGFSSEEDALNRAELAYVHDVDRGGIMAKYRQEIQGVEVFNREFNVMMDRELNLVAGSGYFSNPFPANKTLELFASFGSAEAAIHAAIADLSGGDTQASLEPAGNNGKYKLFNATTLEGLNVIGQPASKRVIFDNNGELIAAHYVIVRLADFESLDSNDYSYVIDGKGKVLFRKNLVSHDSHATYRVFADADGRPFEGPHGDVVPQLNPGTDTTDIVDMPLVTVDYFEKLSTGDPWLPEDATVTSGNNVFAYADVLPPQGFTFGDLTAEMTSDRTFDYPYNPDETDNSLANRKSAVVNMFVMNNYMHNWWYDHGFDEASGNAQLSNYGRGGEEGDPIEAQAQDSSGLNNANMATPPDGFSPRMQQYLWNSKDAENGVDQGITITSHEALGLLDPVQSSAFGPVQFPVTSGVLVRINDGNDVDSGSVTDGCEAAVNPEELAGNIAIIDRGSCTFVSKVLNAQTAGAIAVIIANNNDDGAPAPMGGGDPAVTIPNMGINFEDGQAIYALQEAGETVTAEMFSNFPLKDSSLDNGIIAHEWGHYIQNRLVGNASGLINFQGRNMGEGWSDFHGLMFLLKPEDVNIEGNENWQVPYQISTFVADFYRGIRRAPYTPNMDINPLTFQHITNDAVPPGLPPTNGGSPHAAGEVWATMLWDIYVGLLNTYEFAEAEARMANYLVAGYKMTPVAPTYVEARDALLAAMYANDVDDYQLALNAFARRGMGLGAVAPDRFSQDNVGVVESYETQLATYSASNFALDENYDSVDAGFCTADGILDAGETGSVSFTITNAGSEVLTDVVAQVSVVSDHDVTLENDGMVTISEIGVLESVSGQLEITLNAAGVGDTLQLEVTFPEAAESDEIIEAASLSVSTTVNLDFETAELVGTSATADMEDLAVFSDFKENVLKGDAAGTQQVDTVNTGFFQFLNPLVNLGAQTMFLVNNAFESDVAVETDVMQVGYGQNFSMSFWHFYWLEESWDGGVIEISINGSPWIDVLDAGGQFDVGYNYAELTPNSSQSLQGRPVFSGINGDLATFAGNMDRVSFGTFLNGQSVQFRFRISSDVTVSSFGWNIDNVTFTNIVSPVFNEVVAGDSVTSCDNVAPRVTLSDTEVSVEEGVATSVTATATDRNEGDTLSYSWVQTGGTAATIEGADTATMTFTADVTADETLTFAVTVSDGTEDVTSNFSANVSDVPPPPAPPPVAPSNSGGGSMGWLALLLVPLAWVRRRLSK